MFGITKKNQWTMDQKKIEISVINGEAQAVHSVPLRLLGTASEGDSERVVKEGES